MSTESSSTPVRGTSHPSRTTRPPPGRPSRPPARHFQEGVSTLRDAAKDLVLDAARLWREQKGVAWTERVLTSALDILVRSETVLGEVLDGEPARH